jgi:hypothetical protein
MADYDTFHEEATRVIGEEEPDLPDEEVERRADELWRADQQTSRPVGRLVGHAAAGPVSRRPSGGSYRGRRPGGRRT